MTDSVEIPLDQPKPKEPEPEPEEPIIIDNTTACGGDEIMSFNIEDQNIGIS